MLREGRRTRAPHSGSALDDQLPPYAAPIIREDNANDIRAGEIAARRRRAQTLRACAAAYQHLHSRGLVSEVVVAELQRLLQEAAP